MKVLIFGATGQDGSYLMEQLQAAGHDVWGTHHKWIRPLGPKYLHADLCTQVSLRYVLDVVQPDVVYNLAAITAPGGAWGAPQPDNIADVTAFGVGRIMEAMRKVTPDARLVHSSSSAIYHPHRYGLYGISKEFAHNVVQGYRTGFGMHVSNAILYSHTSSRQDPRFLAPTVINTLARIKGGSDEKLKLTELTGRRDWGYAPDFMKALPLIAQVDTPGDFVVATGETHSVWEFVNTALEVAELTWEGAVTVTRNDIPPMEKRANILPIQKLGWEQETSFEDMVTLLMKKALK